MDLGIWELQEQYLVYPRCLKIIYFRHTYRVMEYLPDNIDIIRNGAHFQLPNLGTLEEPTARREQRD